MRVTPEPGTHRATVAADGEHFVDVASSRTRPPVTTLRDRSGRVVKLLDDAEDDPRVDELKLTPPALASSRTATE